MKISDSNFKISSYNSRHELCMPQKLRHRKLYKISVHNTTKKTITQSDVKEAATVQTYGGVFS